MVAQFEVDLGEKHEVLRAYLQHIQLCSENWGSVQL